MKNNITKCELLEFILKFETDNRLLALYEKKYFFKPVQNSE